jgi:hypothetical protein
MLFHYDPRIKKKKKVSSGQQAFLSDRKSKTRMPRLQVKTMLNVFFDIKGIVLHEYLPVGYMVNQYFSKMFWNM